jgi:hypothetical protein
MITLTLKQLNYASLTGALDLLVRVNKPLYYKIANRKMPIESGEALQIFNDEKQRLAANLGIENKETHRYERSIENKPLYDKIALLENQTIDLSGIAIPFAELKEEDPVTKVEKQWEPNEQILGALEPFIIFDSPIIKL